MKLLTVLFLVLLGCILTHSQISLSYAAMGLNLWFEKMIPSLLPFMILSGIMVRLKLTDKVAMIVYPVVKPLYKIRRNVCYAMLMGFLCGFPMGARVVADLYTRQMIGKREAEFLLAFCNNIGPVYFCSFVLPLLGRKLVLPYLFGMYGIPLLYGLALRYTAFRDLPQENGVALSRSTKNLVSCERPALHSFKSLAVPKNQAISKGLSVQGLPASCHSKDLTACQINRQAKPRSRPSGLFPAEKSAERFLEAVDESVHASMQSILSLGGYMVLFNLLNLVPHLLLGGPLRELAPLLEITGGLTMLGDAFPLYSLLALSFGGLSCIAQTYNCIGDSDLSINCYIRQKILLTLLAGGFYLGWFLLLPGSFLR
nr:hypothetical protein [uncultured Acetatifactor sp.]